MSLLDSIPILEPLGLNFWLCLLLANGIVNHVGVLIRDARPDDWPAIWPFLREIVAAGETYTWDPGCSEADARSAWLHESSGTEDEPKLDRGRTFVAVDPDGTILGTAEMHPNQAGPGSHVANAGFMINGAHAGHGIGRALAEHVLDQARSDGYRAMQFNAVVETNTRAIALWRSLGFRIVGTVPDAFCHPNEGYVSLHIMHRRL